MVYPDLELVGEAENGEEAVTRAALQAGAIGHMLKNVSAAELANAIRSAYAKRMTLSSEAAQALVQSRLPTVPREDGLTEREHEVLSWMVEGLNNSEIAEKLVVSPSTVKFHIGNIFSKLGVDNRVAAVSLAIQRKLV